jgi:hypothetical protein
MGARNDLEPLHNLGDLAGGRARRCRQRPPKSGGFYHDPGEPLQVK